MRKIKSLTACVIVLAMAFSTAVMAAPSPAAGVVAVVVPGSAAAKPAEVKAPTEAEIKAITDFIAKNAAATGTIPSVKSTIDIVAPADYKGGNAPVVFAVAGLRDGAKNVFAYIRLKNGKVLIIPCAVKNGYVGFYAPAFGTISIVEHISAPTAAAPAGSAVPATLH